MPSSLLITGPPASGKSRAAIERFLAAPDSLLLVPTRTMAEHLRNEFARAELPVRPNRVMTLARFPESAAIPALAPAPLVHFLIREALAELRLTRFAPIEEHRGFHAALAALMDEAPAEAVDHDLALIFRHVESALAARGLALRNARLEAAARDKGPLPPQMVFDGFFSFSQPEMTLIESLAARSALAITLPDWPGGTEVRARLLSLGFIERRLAEAHRQACKYAFSAPTLTCEVEELARRILEQHSRGRAFREMGIILRAREPYAAALETALARFGIPARFYFADAVIAYPAIAYLAGMVAALLGGFDRAALLALLRMPVSGVGATEAGDRFDFEMRERLPSAGLPVDGIARVPPVLDSLASMSAWRSERLDPQEWAQRLKTLRRLLPEPAISDRISQRQLRILQSTKAGLDAFDAALDQTAAALSGAGAISLADFWRQAEVALSIERLQIADRRRDAVAVLDVFEARQWELPVVFICGLTERHFPQYHREDPLLNDAARRRAGLKTSGDLQDEEPALFQFALTRATELAVLSYPRFTDQGEETLPSFFLEGTDVAPCERRARPAPLRTPAVPVPAPIQEPALLARLALAQKKLAPTSIESFLQCPFQFFARKTLRLRSRPAAPRDRLDLLLQGGILHRALAEFTRTPLLGAAAFDAVFAEEIEEKRVAPSYRTEAVHLELLRHFEGFLADRQVALGWTSRVEEEFSFALNPLLTIAGRIDRLDIGSRNQALVIDYKYSAPDKIRERVEEHQAGNLVQGGLYLLAAERCFGLEPAGMLYCGLRKQVVWDGWHAPVAGLEAIGESRTASGLRELIDAAAAKAVESYEAILSGRIGAQPTDPDKCVWCDFRDICRVEAAAPQAAAGAA